MKYDTVIYLVAFFGLINARPTSLNRREVPQEKSHNKYLESVRKSLNLNNPDKIVDPVFGLLGNAAAQKGAGAITNLDCLHQATADRAFTNAKAAGDVQGMTDALVFQALERNTGEVGLASVICTETPVNPEIGAFQQHQDPASTNAAAINKAIVLELAKQIAAIGGDAQLALESGTFAPGEIGDPTAAGNTCDDEDPIGCIFTKNLLVEDATAEEIDAAVAGAGGEVAAPPAAGNETAGVTPPVAGNETVAAPPAADACPAVTTVTVDPPAATGTGVASPIESAPAAEVTETPTPASGGNVQTFTGTKGGPAPPVESSAGDRPFSVKGNTFVNIGAALQRSCAIQNNACANAINSGELDGNVSECNDQEKECNAAGGA